MNDLIKPKLKVQALVALSCFSCLLPTASSAKGKGTVVINYRGLFDLDSSVQAMDVVSANHRQLSNSSISNSRTEAQR